jgi:probable DNA metabolism protein
MELYLICEDSLEGIFTAIYEAYASKRPAEEIHLQIGEEENLRLFAEYKNIASDPNKAAKVARTIGKRFGKETYISICHALASPEPEKAEAVYKTLAHGLNRDPRQQRPLMEDLANPYVMKVFELARGSSNETHHLLGFIRFRELENGILYARIAPKNNVLTFVAPHFADRMPQENFVIHDEARHLYVLHPNGKEWYVVSEETGLKFDSAKAQYSEGERHYSELFSDFFQTIAIGERHNPKLQRQNLPLRFREYMTEWQ